MPITLTKSEMETKRIDLNLSDFRGQNSSLFTGRPQGLQVRNVLDLDNKDLDNEKYLVLIPQGTTSINPSFFLGLFFNSIKKLGVSGFNEKYKFEFLDSSERVSNILFGHIKEALDFSVNSMKDNNTLKRIFS